MEPSALSSNWRALQARLQAEQRSNISTKRKASDAQLPHSSQHDKKRHKANPQPNGKKSAKTPIFRPASVSNRPSKPNLRTTTTSTTSNTTSASTKPTLQTPTNPSDPSTASSTSSNAGLHPQHSTLAGKYVSLDCEMVGSALNTSLLARASIVNYHGTQLYDSYVQPTERVADYRTSISGIRPAHLRRDVARPLHAVKADIARLLDGRILVGHGVRHDLAALALRHPPRDVRDTSLHGKFRALAEGKTPGLRMLAKSVLGVEIQGGAAGHSSVEDARAAMALFRAERGGFEGGAGGRRDGGLEGVEERVGGGEKRRKKKKKGQKGRK